MNESRSIFAMMSVAVLFALVASEAGRSNAQGPQPPIADPVTIILGGAVATAMLVSAAEFIPQSQSFAKGLAAVALVSSLALNGTVVFGLIPKTQSAPSTPSAPSGGK